VTEDEEEDQAWPRFKSSRWSYSAKVSMTHIDFQALERDDGYLVDLGANTWLMDNHKWALWVWERHRLNVGIDKFTLAHADHHWDGGYHPYESAEMREQLAVADIDQLKQLIDEDVWIRYDSFIAPAVVRGRFDAVHFYCKQDNGYDIGVAEELLAEAQTTQVIHETVQSFATIHPNRPLIFDLCLDLFNKEQTMTYQGDLWSDQEIEEFLEAVRPLVVSASLVTVSLSFECSGTEADTRHLAALALPRITAWRGC
jgi:hypothetical protein